MMITFKDLFAGYKILKGSHLLDQAVKSITQNSKNVMAGSLFIAEKGSKNDGHLYIESAINNGAAALLVEDPSKVPTSYNGIIAQVESTRANLSSLSAKYFNFPSEKLFCIGVTGTNGKTSTTYLVESILNSQKIPTGVIGTINHHIDGRSWETSMTTPDPLSLQSRLNDFMHLNAKALAIEISSHSLDQKRAEGIEFDVGIFTNLTRDHLDYHETMEKYFQAKSRLFAELLQKSKKVKTAAFVNGDDEWAIKTQATAKMPVYTFGKTSKSSLYFELLSIDFFRTQFKFFSPWGNAHISLPMIGTHNIYNAMGSIGACLFQGQNLTDIAQALENFSGVPGRLHMVPNNKQKAVFIDYAHTPDALENVLLSLQHIRREKKSNQKIITVFGCGGDRDKGKRPQMAAIAEKYSDFAIVTSDNPRSEDPGKIIGEILTGFAKSNYINVPDRKSAIAHAIKIAVPEDVILIAGKGHETYQIIGNEKFYFNDFEVAQELLK